MYVCVYKVCIIVYWFCVFKYVLLCLLCLCVVYVLAGEVCFIFGIISITTLMKLSIIISSSDVLAGEDADQVVQRHGAGVAAQLLPSV